MHYERKRKRGEVGQPSPEHNIGQPWLGTNGYMKTTRQGKEIYIHRLRYEQAFGPIPEGYHVHHVDGNKINNHPMNLMLMEESEHHKFHGNIIDWK